MDSDPGSLPSQLEREVLQALEWGPDRRAAELDRLCAAQPDRADAIREYVTIADDVAAAFRSMPRPQGDAATPEMIGSYRILDVLGQGGMGTVYLADQTEPLQRKVALKVIKLGMDSAQIRARFESERQTLAAMNHDHIARLYDAGLTGRGQSFFAMEYVEGLPLDRHCDERRLPPRARLELFLRVCEGVQHAHQRGIIHRDLKPSNILVSMQDGRAVPKIIDFGLARAVERAADEDPAATFHGQLVGTPGYMSPEQIAGDLGSVDTRTDVYALGVVLYDLLVGTLPIDPPPAGRRDSSRYLQLVQQDPPPPSSRLSRLGESAAGVAARRGTEPRALARALRGDLDAIAGRALAPERERRYQAVGDLAEDVRRHLQHEPVLAVAPGAGYRLRKLARRHRVAVAAGGLVLLAALAGLIGILWQADIARDQAALAREQKRIAEQRLVDTEAALASARAVNEFLTLDLLESVRPEEARGREVKVADVLELAAERVGTRFAAQPLIQAAVRYALGDSFEKLGLFQKARPHHETALALRREHLGPGHRDTLSSGRACAGLLMQFGRAEEAESTLREVVATSIDSLGEEDRDTLHSKVRLAHLLHGTNRMEAALAMYRDVLAVQHRILGERHDDTLYTMELVGRVLSNMQRYAEGRTVMEKTLALRREISGDLDPRTRTVINNLANLHHDLGEYATAETYCREALAITKALYGDDNLHYAVVLNNWASLLLDVTHADPAVNRLAEAEELFRQSIAIRKKAWGAQHYRVAIAMNNLGGVLQERGRNEQARAVFEESLAIQKLHPEYTRQTQINTRYNLATIAGELYDHERAVRLAAELLPDAVAAYGAEHSMLARIQQFHAAHLQALGRFTEAEAQYVRAHAISAAALGANARFTLALTARIGAFYRAWHRRDGVDKAADVALWEGRLQEARATTRGR